MAQAHAFKEELRWKETLEWLVTKKQITQEQANKLSTTRKKEPDYHAWIGVNPPPGTVTMRELIDIPLPYQNYEMVVEQHTAGGLRPHLHILAKVSKTTRPKTEINRLAKLYNLLPSSIDYKISINSVITNAHRAYIRGNKASEKAENTASDREAREKESIPHLLSKGIV